MRSTPPILTRLLLIIALGAPFWAASQWVDTPACAAQDKQLESYLVGATEDYDLVMLEDAEQKLKEAIAYAEGKGLATPQLAKVYVMLGIVRFAESQRAEPTEELFTKAVEVDPNVVIDPVYETPELSQIMNRARSKAKPKTAEQTPLAGPFAHTPLSTAPANEPLTLEVTVAKSLPVFRVFLYHRRFGEEAYTAEEMAPRGDTRFGVELPARAVTTSQLEYHIEVLDRTGRVLANFASEAEPQTVVLLGSGQGAAGPEKITTPPEPDDGETDKVFYTFLGAGSGVGFLPGGTPTAYPDDGRDINAGLAAAFGHALVDMGWIINAQMRLGLYFRWQFQPTQDFDQVPEVSKGGSFPSTKDECLGLGLFGDCLLGLKYRYYITQGEPERDVRFYSSVGGGVGRIRHWVELKERAQDPLGNPNPNCEGKPLETSDGVEICNLRDTVRTGWLHLGLGAGVSVPIGEMVEFTADTYLMFLFLDQTSINIDANLGFVLKF